jgi:hypothetical protein
MNSSADARRRKPSRFSPRFQPGTANICLIPKRSSSVEFRIKELADSAAQKHRHPRPVVLIRHRSERSSQRKHFSSIQQKLARTFDMADRRKIS